MLVGAGKLRDALCVWEDYGGGSIVKDASAVKAWMRIRKGGLTEADLSGFPPVDK